MFSVVALLMLLFPGESGSRLPAVGGWKEPIAAHFAEFYIPRLVGAPLVGEQNPPEAIDGPCLLCGGFVWKLCRIPPSQIQAQAGLDGYMLYRLTSLTMKVFMLFTAFALLILVPVCYTADDQQADLVNRAGLDNIPNGSPRMWAFTVSVYLVTAITLGLLYQVAIEYALLRRKYLRDTVLNAGGASKAKPISGSAGGPAAPHPTATASVRYTTHVGLKYAAECAVRPFGDDGSAAWPRTVMAMDVPERIKNSSQLLRLFRSLYPGEVEAALLVAATGDVEDLQDEREGLAVLYESARWLHRGRSNPIQRVVFARRCGPVDKLCGILGCDELHVEDSRWLPSDAAMAADEEEDEDSDEDPEVAIARSEAPRHVHGAEASIQRETLSFSLDPHFSDAMFFGESSDRRGGYCCCCLPCGLCKRGRVCHCVVACRSCCGSVEPALPKLRQELLETNAVLHAKRMKWWRNAKAEELAERGVVTEERPKKRSKEARRAAQQARIARLRRKPSQSEGGADHAGGPPPETEESKKSKKQKGQGSVGFITFKTARTAVLAAGSYHLPAAAFDTPAPAAAAAAATGGASAHRPVSVAGAAAKMGGVIDLSTIFGAAKSLVANPPMRIEAAPRPLDVNFKASIKSSREQNAAQWFVTGLRVALLVVYSLLAIAVAAGGGTGEEGGSTTTTTVLNGTAAGNSTVPAEEESITTGDANLDGVLNFFITLYEGLGQSFLLALLLNFLPTILGIFADLSQFKVSTEVRGFLISNLFFFRAWTGIVMVTVGESLQATLQQLASSPFELITVLGTDLPKFASFYISFILLKALADFPRGLLQLFGLLFYAVRYKRKPQLGAVFESTLASAVSAVKVASSVTSAGLGAVKSVTGKQSSGGGVATPPAPPPSDGAQGGIQYDSDGSAGVQGGHHGDDGIPMQIHGPAGLVPPSRVRARGHSAAASEAKKPPPPPPLAGPQYNALDGGRSTANTAGRERTVMFDDGSGAATAPQEPSDTETEAGGDGVMGEAVPRPDLEDVATGFHQSPRQFVDNIVDGPGEFDYEDALSEYLFLVLIGFVFGAMVPVLPPLIALCLGVMGTVYRYQLVYLNKRASDTGAAYVPSVLNRLAFALAMQQAVLASLLFVREQSIAAAFILIPLLVTYLFMKIVNERILGKANQLSLQEAVQADAKNDVRSRLRQQSMSNAATEASSVNVAVATATAGQALSAQEIKKLREEAIVTEFVRGLLTTHAYIPPALLPHRDTQPGIIVLPPVVDVDLKASAADGALARRDSMASLGAGQAQGMKAVLKGDVAGIQRLMHDAEQPVGKAP